MATEAAERLTTMGTEAIDLHRIAKAAAYYAVMGVIGTIDDGDWDDSYKGPGWTLMETDSEGEITGRSINGLHESLTHIFPKDP